MDTHPDTRGVESLLTSVGIPASGVARTSDLVERDEHLRSRGFFRTLEHAVIGPHLNRGPAFKLSRSEDCQFAGPALGQHNDRVFRELLGMTEGEVGEAIDEHGITTAVSVGGSGARPVSGPETTTDRSSDATAETASLDSAAGGG